jgi:hypothetical protein
LTSKIFNTIKTKLFMKSEMQDATIYKHKMLGVFAESELPDVSVLFSVQVNE